MTSNIALVILPVLVIAIAQRYRFNLQGEGAIYPKTRHPLGIPLVRG